MMMAAVGTLADSFSAVSIPSRPGMLMSIRTTSGSSLAAISRPSAPLSATPTTSTSVSKESSFERWSRVSAMSSTMTTRILSLMLGPASLGVLGLTLSGQRDDDRPRRQHAVLVHELAKRHARGLLVGRRGVGRRPHDQRQVAVELGEANQLSLLGRDADDRDAPAGERQTGVGVDFRPTIGAQRRSEDAQHLH